MALAEILTTAEAGTSLFSLLMQFGDKAKDQPSDDATKALHLHLIDLCGELAKRYDSLGRSLLADGEIDWAALSYVGYVAGVVEKGSKKAAAPSRPASTLSASIKESGDRIARELGAPLEGLGDGDDRLAAVETLDPGDRRRRGLKALELSGQLAALADLLKVYPTMLSLLAGR